ncbi:MAG: glycosyltransferase family 2 protein [Anaerolineaceae bacterium]|nr:glycosyltransferase family 2 protein [Anaerolineaceae bacterium]
MMPTPHLPFVSILLPIRDETDTIERCLAAVLAQDYPLERLEVLIADGMSADGTRAQLEAVSVAHPHVQVFDNPGQIVSTGLNLLTCEAHGDVLIRVDGHCAIAPDYVRNCVRRLAQDQVDVVGGPMRSIGETFVSENISVATSSRFGVGYSVFRTETGVTRQVDTVPFPALTREMIAQVGLYDEELVRDQDDEHNYRIRKAGGVVLLADEVRSDYYSRSSLCTLWRQYFGYGFWKVRVMQKHPRQMRPRQFVPFAFVLSLIVLTLWGLIVPGGWVPLAVFVGAYLLANLTASILTAAQRGWRYLPLLPLAYTTLHLSYGLGFLAGLVRFIHRWGDREGKVPELPEGWENLAGTR